MHIDVRFKMTNSRVNNYSEAYRRLHAYSLDPFYLAHLRCDITTAT